MKKISTLYVLAIVLTGVSAYAQNGNSSPLMQAIDRNGDGSLQQSEIDMAVSALRGLDLDKDGTVSSEELTGNKSSKKATATNREGRRGRMDLSMLDADNDGKISKEEAPERLKKRFDMIDTNGDGFLDKTEQDQLMQRMRERGQQGQRSGMEANKRETPGGEQPKRPEPIE